MAIAFAYGNIINFYRDSLKSRLRANEQEYRFSPAERKLIVRLAAVFFCYLFCRCPYLILIIFQMSTKKPADPEFELICIFFIALFPLFQNIVLYTFDPTIKVSIDDATYIGSLVNFIVDFFKKIFSCMRAVLQKLLAANLEKDIELLGMNPQINTIKIQLVMQGQMAQQDTIKSPIPS